MTLAERKLHVLPFIAKILGFSFIG